MNASEKIGSFSGRLMFLLHFCYFSSNLFGGNEIFRIFVALISAVVPLSTK